MESNSHLDKFTSIHDMNGVPICNGDTIRVYDSGEEPIIGTVIWKNGSYVFDGTHWCEYNIYAWRDKIEVLETDRPSIYKESTINELLESWESKNLNFLLTDRKLIRKAFIDGAIAIYELSSNLALTTKINKPDKPLTNGSK